MQAFGPTHSGTLSAMNNLASLYCDLEKYDLAEPLYKEAYERRSEILAPDHPKLLTSMNNLANLYCDMKKYNLAEPLFRKCFEVRSESLGPEHIDTVSSMADLASTFADQEKFDDALPIYVKCLDIQRSTLGDYHEQTIKSILAVAKIYLNLKRYAEIEPLYRLGIQINIKVLGKFDIRTINSVQSLANIYYLQNKFSAAEPLYETAYKGYRALNGENHPNNVDIMIELANTYFNMKTFDKSIALYEKAIAIQVATHGEDYYDVIFLQSELSKIKAFLEKVEREAMEAAEEVSPRESVFDMSSPRFVRVEQVDHAAATDEGEAAAEEDDEITQTHIRSNVITEYLEESVDPAFQAAPEVAANESPIAKAISDLSPVSKSISSFSPVGSKPSESPVPESSESPVYSNPAESPLYSSPIPAARPRAVSDADFGISGESYQESQWASSLPVDDSSILQQTQFSSKKLSTKSKNILFASKLKNRVIPKNSKNLRALNLNDVSKLLSNLKLAEYENQFLDQRITGAVLNEIESVSELSDCNVHLPEDVATKFVNELREFRVSGVQNTLLA